MAMQTLAELIAGYENTVERTKYIHEAFCDFVNADFRLKALRDWVEKNHWGMGERSFYWMWKLIIESLPPSDRPWLLEIGVHRGQTLALWATIEPNAWITGVSPFDGTEVGEKRDYEVDVLALFKEFDLPEPILIRGMSQDPEVIKEVSEASFEKMVYNVVYIDGGHSYETTKSDILNYAPLITPGGYLVIDDSARRGFAHPWGYFMGIDTVCQAVDELLPPHGKSALGEQFEHLFHVVHNRVWRKRK